MAKEYLELIGLYEHLDACIVEEENTNKRRIKRWCTVDEFNYARGALPPRYPVPSTIGSVHLATSSAMCCLYAADQERPNPLITWYDLEFAKKHHLQIPEDHGKVVEWN